MLIMAVEAFLKPSDSKLTVEKEVKRKPSVEELTTVESPGRPSPANLLENNAVKKTKKRFPKKNYSDDVKVTSVKKDTILIITEKPQAAMKIANAIGNARKLSEEGVNYYELEDKGNKIVVASAVGHLFGLTYKAGQKGWPIYELEWVPSFNRKESFFTKKYYSLLKKLSRRAKEIIVATDFDIEGEVIGWNVLRFICNEKNAKRMKFSTLTNDELRKAFDSPMKEMAWGNAYAGETRHILDWLYGINLSRALMSSLKNVGAFRLLSIGRVQGPALKIIVDREREIINFKPVPYWNVNALAEGVIFRHPKDIFDKKELEKLGTIKEYE
jgi:DNA topoisomerase-1